MRIHAGGVDGDDQVLLWVNGDRLPISPDCFVSTVLTDLSIIAIADNVLGWLGRLRRPRLMDPTIGQNIDAASTPAFVHEHGSPGWFVSSRGVSTYVESANYPLRSASETGIRIDRRAGNRPPSRPIKHAQTTASITNWGVTLSLNTTCAKAPPSVDTV